jgi:cell division protein FtsQ
VAAVPRPSSRRLRARQLALGVIAAGVAAAGYVAVRDSSLYAVEQVRVEGASPVVATAVAARVRALVGSRGLLAVDPGTLARGIVELPTVRFAHVDRAFPHTLVVRVEPELPVAVVETPAGRFAVARSGRIVAQVPSRGRLPVLDTSGARVPGPGGSLARQLGDELSVAALARRRGLSSLAVIGQSPDGLVARIGKAEAIVRLGDGSDLGDKLSIAAALLRNRPRDASGKHAPLQYVDVSVPAHPALRGAAADPATLPDGSQPVSDLRAGAPVDVAQLVNDLFRPPTR